MAADFWIEVTHELTQLLDVEEMLGKIGLTLLDKTYTTPIWPEEHAVYLWLVHDPEAPQELQGRNVVLELTQKPRNPNWVYDGEAPVYDVEITNRRAI